MRVYRHLRLELQGHAWTRPTGSLAPPQYQSRCKTSQVIATTVSFRDHGDNQSEVKELIDSGVIREDQHPNWVANIIPVPKKNGKI